MKAESPEKAFLVPAILFLVTLLTTVTAGFIFHVHFTDELQEGIILRQLLANPMNLLHGLPFSFTLLSILLAHEMGHYLTCRYYGIRATLPYMIPAPPPFNPFGTFGAVIKIKSNFHNRRQLFDVGIAGPLGGFFFIIPALVIGLQESKEFVFTGSPEGTLQFGEPLLFSLISLLFFTGEGEMLLNLHPIGWAAWFGMLATSINLLPVGQLDGGHIVYALFGARGHRILSIAMLAGLVGISFFSWPMMGYLVFVLIIMFLGFQHPRPDSELVHLGKARYIVALIGLIVLILTFIPIPVQVVEEFGRL